MVKYWKRQMFEVANPWADTGEADWLEVGHPSVNTLAWESMTSVPLIFPRVGRDLAI